MLHNKVASSFLLSLFSSSIIYFTAFLHFTYNFSNILLWISPFIYFVIKKYFFITKYQIESNAYNQPIFHITKERDYNAENQTRYGYWSQYQPASSACRLDAGPDSRPLAAYGNQNIEKQLCKNRN